jgi:hypothetical protein
MNRLVVVLLFCLSLAVMGVMPAFESDASRDARVRVERRALAPFPDIFANDAVISIFQFPTGFDLWANDNVGFRTSLVWLHGFIHTRLFGDLPSSRYIRGKNGWFFRGSAARRGAKGSDDSYNDLVDIAGRAPLSESELDDWRRRLVRRREIATDYGAAYLFGIGPRKSTIYPELLPDLVATVLGRTRLDQFQDVIGAALPGIVVDLRGALLEGKSRALYPRLFYRTDSHWNYYGAYFAYEAFMRRAAILLNRSDLAPIPLSSFEIRERHDWSHRGFFAETRLREVESVPILYPSTIGPYGHVEVVWPKSRDVEVGDDEESVGSKAMLPFVGIGVADMEVHQVIFNDARQASGCRYARNRAAGLPLRQVVLLGDSFLQTAAPYFSAHAEHTYLCRQTKAMAIPIFDNMLDSYIKPDLIVQELMESYLGLAR